MLILLNHKVQSLGHAQWNHVKREPIQVATKHFISLEICLKSSYPFIMLRAREAIVGILSVSALILSFLLDHFLIREK